LIFLAIVSNAKATHIVGGELYYRYDGNNNYTIFFDFYLDCINGVPAAINSDISGSDFGFFDGITNARIANLDRIGVRPGAPTRVSSTNYKCVITIPNACVDRYRFQFTVNLPLRTGGYIIAYQRCCRNGTITNLSNPQGTGSTYWTKVENLSSRNWVNNSAVFSGLPPNFLCTNAPLTFNHSAIDPDGDSLVYELFRPNNSFRGMVGASSTNDQPKPTPAQFMPPPFTEVNFLASYNENNPIDGLPSLSIDSKTGELTLTPTLVGQFVIGILVKEFRKGILVGTTRRDYQFNVSNCTFEIVSSFFAPNINCNHLVNFNNNSFGNNISFEWDFGDPKKTTDISSIRSPSYVYDTAGIYEVKLIAKNNNCADTYRRTLRIISPIRPGLGSDEVLCNPFIKGLKVKNEGYPTMWNTGATSDSITVSKEGAYHVLVTKMGCNYRDTIVIKEDRDFPKLPNDSIICSNTPINQVLNPGNQYARYEWNTNEVTASILASEAKKYKVTVTTINGCLFMDSVIYGLVNPPSILLSDTLICPQQKAILVPKNVDVNIPILEYLWSNGSTSNSISVLDTIDYWVQIYNGKCYNRDTAKVKNEDLGEWGLPEDTAFCDKVLKLLDPGSQFSIYKWSNGETTQQYTATEPGKYKVQLWSDAGCIVNDSISLILNPLPIILMGNDTTICIGVELTLDAGVAVSYLWHDGSVERLKLTVDSGLYFVKVIDKNDCVKIDSIHINKNPFALPSDMYMPNSFTPNDDGLNEVYPNHQFSNIGLEYDLKIFNRWGEKMADFSSPNLNWDGKNKGIIVPKEVYIYLVTWVGCDNVRRQIKGDVTVLK